MRKYKDTGCGINWIETTNATLSNRGGLAFILRYIESIEFFRLIEATLHSLCLHSKGEKASFIVRQIIAFLIDGTFRTISSFDTLRIDDGYAAILEVKKKNRLSSHAVRRFFRKFTYIKCVWL
jgi:hypothetical protein